VYGCHECLLEAASSCPSCSCPSLPSSPNTLPHPLPPHPDVVAVLLQDPNTLSPVGPSTPQQPTSEPVYAQVNRDRKKQSTTRSDSSSTQALLGSSSDGQNNFQYDPNNEPIYPPAMPAGDSWV